MILYVSDITPQGSGFSSIATNLCSRLADSGKRVVALSMTYRGEEHDFPFAIVPSRPEWIAAEISGLMHDQGAKVEAVVLAYDIPYLLQYMQRIKRNPAVPIIGIFPVEAPPLCASWTAGLWDFDARLVISEFGTKVCEEAGLPATWLPIPADKEYFPIEGWDRSATLASLGLEPEHFVVLTVADNHERKFLSRSMEIFAQFSQSVPEARYVLVTRLMNPVGYKLHDLAQHLGIMDKVRFVERGMTNDALAALYRSADVFLLTSKAEGLGLPIREAMACGCLVAATHATGMGEQIEDGRGFSIWPDYDFIESWGNSTRYLAAIDSGVHALNQAHAAEKYRTVRDYYIERMREKSLEYARSFNWDATTEILVQTLQSLSQPTERSTTSNAALRPLRNRVSPPV